MIKNLKKVDKRNFQRFLLTGMIMILILLPQFTFAAPVDTSKVDTIINDVVVPWVQKIGFLIAFIGGIMFALGWRNDDADSKARGLQTLVSGFMVAAVALSYNLFIN